MRNKIASLSFEEALAKAARLCSQSEKSPKEILDKLQVWGLPFLQAEKVVKKLKEESYLDKKRFAHSFVHDKFAYDHWGKVKIAYYLRNKGIDEQTISLMIDEVIDDEEYESLLIDLLSSKARNMSFPLSDSDRAKLYRFAVQRGFESHIISRALGKLHFHSF